MIEDILPFVLNTKHFLLKAVMDMDVSKANFFLSEANIFVSKASKLSAGARISEILVYYDYYQC